MVTGPEEGTLTFFYDYGGGTTSVDAQLTPTAPSDVCQIIDAGHD